MCSVKGELSVSLKLCPCDADEIVRGFQYYGRCQRETGELGLADRQSEWSRTRTDTS